MEHRAFCHSHSHSHSSSLLPLLIAPLSSSSHLHTPSSPRSSSISTSLPYHCHPPPPRRGSELCFVAKPSFSCIEEDEGLRQHPWRGTIGTLHPTYAKEDVEETLSSQNEGNSSNQGTIALHDDDDDDEEEEEGTLRLHEYDEEETVALYTSSKKKKGRCVSLVMEGNDPIETLQTMPEWKPSELWTLLYYLAAQRRFDEALQVPLYFFPFLISSVHSLWF